jgi:lysophospholipase L1-like esterase
VSCVFFLFLAEAGFRLIPKKNNFRHAFELSQFKSDNPNINTLNRADWRPRFRPSSIVGYEKIPNSSPEVNSYGMTGKEYRSKKEKNIFRILVLGDSITEFDWYVRSLEDKLNNDPKASHKFELWNAGVCGYEVNQYANYLKFKGLRYKPDMVLIGLCLNDFNVRGTLITYKDKKGFTGYYYSGYGLQRALPINSFLFRSSYLYRFLYITLDNFLINQDPGKFIDERVRTGRTCLKEIKELCGSRNIGLTVVIFPYLKPVKEYNPEEYKNIILVLEALKIDFIDLHDFFPRDRESLEKLRFFKDDFIHPSREGHEIAAKAIFDHLYEKNFIN